MPHHLVAKGAHNSNHEVVDDLRIVAHVCNIAALVLSDIPEDKQLGRIGTSLAIIAGVEAVAWLAKQLF